MAGYIIYNDRIPEQITYADLFDKITNYALSPGYQYTFTKSHVVPGGEWKITVTALSSNTIDPNATADFYIGGNFVFTASIIYDSATNSIFKVEEGYTFNIVEGVNNVNYFKWGDPNWNNNYISADSDAWQVYFDTLIYKFRKNYIKKSTIIDGLNNDDIMDEFNDNIIIDSVIYFDGTSNGFFNKNNIRNSEINFNFKFNITTERNDIANSIINLTGIGSNISNYNRIYNSNFYIENGTTLLSCTIDGITGNIDTAIVYNGNSYMKNEYSNFWAVYDFSDGVIYNNPTETFTVPSQHTGWVGKFIVQSNVTGDAIGTIVNAPTNHKFFICQESGVDLTINPTLTNIATPGALPITLNISQLDFAEFDGRLWTYGPGPSLITVVNYGVY